MYSLSTFFFKLKFARGKLFEVQLRSLVFGIRLKIDPQFTINHLFILYIYLTGEALNVIDVNINEYTHTFLDIRGRLSS